MTSPGLTLFLSRNSTKESVYLELYIGQPPEAKGTSLSVDN